MATTTFPPFPSYVLGAACCVRGMMALFSLKNGYAHMGLPLEFPPPSHGAPDSTRGLVSPLMYLKGIREISYGVTLIVLQQQGNELAVTTFAAILSLVRFGDGLVVWFNAGERLRFMAWGHWITSFGFVGWVAWRWAGARRMLV
ncbi:hypothetical protein G7046_g52 [Stylonectria norvegica]|nr:hypothetical protein G7046_g52 [Stylonectria norvegica]